MFEFGDNTRIVFDESESSFVDDKICPKCNTALSDFLRNGIVGCSVCYEVFSAEIKSFLLKKQGSVNHVGKVSLKHNSKIKTKELILRLEKEKEQAAEEENYILAEDLKNKIEKLKGEL